jgi:hypothetical protein
MKEGCNVAFELICLPSNIRKKVYIRLDFFLSFLRIWKKTYNMLSLMLDSKFQNLCLMSFFIGCEQGVAIIEEYDARFSHPMFLKCYHHCLQWLNQKMNLLTKQWCKSYFGYLWHGNQNKWTNKRDCQKKVLNFHALSNGC